MLELIERLRGRWRARRPDEAGAVLLTVVVVMLVGFLIAATIATSVMYTAQSNVTNRSSTQGFIAAESGRDVAVASLSGAIGPKDIDCNLVSMNDDSDANGNGASDASEAPHWRYQIWSSDSSARPEPSSTSGDWAMSCPTTATKWVWIESTGWEADGAADTTTDSIYPWFHGPATQPAGTLAFFEGAFKATKSTYQGDLVIRDVGDYECNNGASGSIDGDLWVLNGGLVITDDCTITGNIYTRGPIVIKNHKLTVGLDVMSLSGEIQLTAGSVKIGGDVYAAGNITTKNGSGTVDGSFRTTGTMVDHDAAAWKRTDGSAVPALTGQTAPTVAPTLDQVFEATNWIELTSTTTWSSATQPTVSYSGQCTSSALKTVLGSAGDRAIVDMSGCPSAGGINVAPGDVSLARDVVIFVPATATMDLSLGGTIKKAAAATDPQLFIVHADSNGADGQPTCGTGSDKLTASATNTVRIMIYSACGITKTMSLTLSGQLYMGNDGLHLNGGTFNCEPMSWKPTLSGLSCGVRGSGGIFDPTNTVTRLEKLAYQTER